MKWLILASPLVLGTVAQATPSAPSTPDWTSILTAFGVAAPLVLYIIRDNAKKESRIVLLESRNQELTDAALDRIVPLQQQTIEVLREAKDEMKSASSERERALVMLHQMSGRFDPATLLRIQRALERVEPRDDR